MQTLYKYWIVVFFHFFLLHGYTQHEEEIIDSLNYTYNNISKIGEKRFLAIVDPLLSNPKISVRLKLNAYYFKGQYHNFKGVIDSAIHYAKKIITLTDQKDDELSIGMMNRAYYLLGTANSNKGLNEKGKYWYLKGIEMAERFKEKESDSWLYYFNLHGLAKIYVVLGEFDKALKLFHECTKANLTKELVYGSYINMSNIYSVKKEFNTANIYLAKAQKLCEEESNHKCVAICLLNIGENLHSQGNYDEALKYYDESVKISATYGFKDLKLYNSVQIGSIFKSREQWNDAYLIYTTALTDAIDLNLMEQQMYIYELLADMSLKKNDYKNAFTFQSERYKILDSLNNMQKNKEINELEVKFQTLQKEQEIEVLKITNKNRELQLKNKNEAISNLLLKQKYDSINKANQILSLQGASEKRRIELELLRKDRLLKQNELASEKNTKRLMLVAFLIILIPVIALLFVYYQKLLTQNQLNKKQEEINNEKIYSLVKEQELKLIKASVEGQDKERSRIAQELHDSIGGNLAAIKLQFSKIIHSSNGTLTSINQQLDDTYNQVRTISHNLMPKKFNQNSFIAVLTEYLKNIGEASDIRTNLFVFPDNHTIDKIDEKILVEIYKIIQELITNTIKHARASKIDIQFNLIGNDVNILYEDNGSGFIPEKVNYGIGFLNIQNRIKKINGSINIDSILNRGTIINLEIPVRNP
ncbi:tetratricopeptide repeat-containing sensor histidine kinase [Abyssalbus ytuae]|uniref:histidine kinase n=1 Tax=Abyssalbus ytuae TaxID=2926907 RepID=A0A9E6ZQ42_9FLAO|nr:sensor histidine kinase [Abyssalbus ytuae]UOB18510.1 sensor histidine kinase [Abyssalbus ytuae]